MSHVLKKKKNKKTTITPKYSSLHQKIARRNSGNTITAKAYLRKLDEQNDKKEKT